MNVEGGRARLETQSDSSIPGSLEDSFSDAWMQAMGLSQEDH